MKKIFMITAFLCAMILTTTASAENWINLGGTDDFGNEYFLDTESVTLYKQEGNQLMFYATFRTVFSDKGRQNLGEENLGSSNFTYAFGNYEGKKLFSLLAIKAYALDGTLLGEKEMESPEWKEIKANSVFDAMYNAAYKYL